MTKRQFRFIGAVLTLLAIVVTLIGCTSQPTAQTAATSAAKPAQTSVVQDLPTVNWLYQAHETSLADYMVSENVKFAERVKARTNGKFTITVKLPGELGIERAAVPTALGKGTIEMAGIQSNSAEAFIPMMGVFHLPYLGITMDDWAKLADSFMDSQIKPEMNKIGFMPIPGGPSYYTTVLQDLLLKDKLKTVANLEGGKIRVGRKGDLTMLTSMGGQPLYMEFTEVYLGMQRGVVNGLVTGTPAMVNSALFEVGKYLYTISLAPASQWSCVNLQKWASLPEAYQKIVMEESITMHKAMKQNVLGVVKSQQDIMTSKGVQIIDLTPDEKAVWQKNAQAAWDEWAGASAANKQLLISAKTTLGIK